MSNPSDISISLALAAVFGLLHVIFTLRVGDYRFKSKISLGDGGDRELRNRVRAHGNFIENVPIATRRFGDATHIGLLSYIPARGRLTAVVI